MSNLLKQPVQTLPYPLVEPEKPRKCLTAFNLFFRDERDKVVNAIKAAGGVKKIQGSGKTFVTQMARMISAKWKATSEYDRCYYKLLETEDRHRFEAEMKVWRRAVDKLKSDHAVLLSFSDSMDLPESIDSIFDDEFGDTKVTMSPRVAVTAVPVSSRVTPIMPCIGHETRRPGTPTVSVVSESTTASTQKEQMEQVFGDMPFTLLGDIGDDAPWPF